MAADPKIRVLVVDDFAEMREGLRKLLQFESDMEVVGVAGSGKQGVDTTRELKPDVVLLDLNMPDMDGIEVTELIRRRQPSIQVIILSEQSDPNTMRRAMLVGARDFLTKPPARDELVSAIRSAGRVAINERMLAGLIPLSGDGAQASSMLAPAESGKIIFVYSPKGGCGATVVAVNLAIALVNDETRVALVDGNLQFGDTAVFLNEQVRNSILELAPRADELDPEIVEEVMINHKASGLKVLSAPPRPEFAENVSADQFVKVLKYLRRLYKYIIVDASSTLSDAVLAALDLSEVIVLITTQEIPAIKNASLFLSLADGLRINRKRIMLVINRFDKRIGIMPEKISENFKQEIAAVVPFEDHVVVPSINRGVPFVLAERTKPVSKSILALAESIKQRLVELDTASQNGNGYKKR